MAEVEDRVSGVLIGLVAGDRNGGPTQMAIRLAESLQALDKFDIEDVGRRYLSWWREGAFDTGPTTARVFELVNSGASFQEGSARVHEESGGFTAGCNPAHRSAPLSMLAARSDDTLHQAAMAEASLTHGHPLAGDVAAAVVRLCRILIRGVEWRAARNEACAGRLAETQAVLLGLTPETPKSGGFAPDVLAAAIYFLDGSESFRYALQNATEFAGPANYCPVLVGTIGGARWGRARISDDLVRRATPFLRRVRRVTDSLATGWYRVETPRIDA